MLIGYVLKVVGTIDKEGTFMQLCHHPIIEI